MCGIIAVVSRPSGRTPPVADLLARVEDALSGASEAEAGVPASRVEGLRGSCERLEAVDAQLIHGLVMPSKGQHLAGVAGVVA